MSMEKILRSPWRPQNLLHRHLLFFCRSLDHLEELLFDLALNRFLLPIITLRWSLAHSFPLFLCEEGWIKSPPSSSRITATIATTFNLSNLLSSKKTPQSGILPCFLAGLTSSFSSSAPSALTMTILVSLG